MNKDQQKWYTDATNARNANRGRATKSSNDEIKQIERQTEAIKNDTLNSMRRATPESVRYLFSRGVRLNKEEYEALPQEARRAYTRAVDDAIDQERGLPGYQQRWTNYWRNEGIRY